MVQKAAILVGIATIGIAVAVVALVVEGKLPLLMGRSRDSNENGKGSASEENGLTCRIERTLMSLENGGDDETFECTVVSAGREDILKEMSYPIELPLALVLENKKAMDEGNLYVFIPGGYVNEKYIEGIGTMGIDIYVPDGADIRILNNKQARALRRPTRNNNDRKRSLYAKGVRSVMVFRISTDDGSPDVDSNEIEKRLYSSEEFSFAHQFEECSFGQLRFQPVDYRTPVNELYLPGETASFTERSILNAAMRVATNIHGSEIWDNLDHAIFCMPEGTQGKPYIAYSGKNIRWGKCFLHGSLLYLT